MCVLQNFGMVGGFKHLGQSVVVSQCGYYRNFLTVDSCKHVGSVSSSKSMCILQ